MASWQIVCGPAATVSEQYAALEFQRLFKEMTGTVLPVTETATAGMGAVFIGPEAVARTGQPADGRAQGEEAMRIRVAPNAVSIDGGRLRGTLYGVYEFFEELCGVRFLTFDHNRTPKDEERFLRLGFAALGTVLGLHPCLADSATKPATPARANYARPFEPPTHPAFLPLPPGAVEPAGWLRDWCLAARDGFTGHMDEYDDEFKRAWAPDHKMTGEGLLWYKGAWPYEGGGYWFDGLARLGFALHDEALIQQAQRRLYAVADHMNTNGLLFLWWLDRNSPADRKAVTDALGGWPLWACGLLGRAMTGFYAGSGDKHILEALEQAYASDPDCLRWITGSMSNPWPAFDAYSWTGNRGIADALDAMFRNEGARLAPSLNRYRKAPILRPGTTVDNAHVVEFIESTTPWLIGYLWTGDANYLQAAVGWHDLFGASIMTLPLVIPTVSQKPEINRQAPKQHDEPAAKKPNSSAKLLLPSFGRKKVSGQEDKRPTK